MTITLNGTTGITTPAVTNEGAYTGDGVVFADATPSNTLVTDTSGNVGIGTSSPGSKLQVNQELNTTYTTSAINTSVVDFRNTSTTDGTVGAIQLTATGSGTVGIVQLGALQTGTGSAAFVVGTRNIGNYAERMRIDSSGNLLVGVTTAFNSANTILKGTATANLQLTVGGSGNVPGVAFYWANNTGTANAANSVMKVGIMSGTSRSVSAAGTINASGADYAEYMTKAGDFTAAKGDVVGINADGKLTNVFADAISFVVKSTDPSYVGGDTWGRGFDNDSEGLEAARQKVDRIAFAGQVPVNVLGAVVGQYIIPVNDNGAIKGEAVSSPTLEQYQIAVGKVIAIEQDGRARIIVKVA